MIYCTSTAPVAARRTPVRRRDKCSAMRLRGAGPARKEGYLMKDPVKGHWLSSQRRRYFVLAEGAIAWYKDAQAQSTGTAPLGRLVLRSARLDRRGDALVVVPSSADGSLVLRGEGLEAWEAVLRQHVEAAPAPLVVPQTVPPMPPPLAVVPPMPPPPPPPLPQPPLPAPVEILPLALGADCGVLSADMTAQLTTLDDGLVAALQCRDVCLVRTSWLCAQNDDYRIQTRQAGEECDAAFLSPKEAVALVRRGDRSVGVASHGWLSVGNPDPCGHRFRLLRRTLLEDLPYVEALFFDYLSLYQKPRTPEQNEAFQRSLKIVRHRNSHPPSCAPLSHIRCTPAHASALLVADGRPLRVSGRHDRAADPGDPAAAARVRRRALCFRRRRRRDRAPRRARACVSGERAL